MFFYSTFLKYAVGRVEQNKSRLWEVFLRNSRTEVIPPWKNF